MATSIVLIGYRGSGKTTVGRRLAARLACPFIDIDNAIVAGAGMTIRQIFERESEAGFRAREHDAIRSAATQSGAVIAPGGGAVIDEANRALLSEIGPVVWLRAPAEELWRRMCNDPGTCNSRPGLSDLEGEDEVRFTLAQREPIYQSMSSLIVDTQSQDIDRVCQLIEDGLTARGLLCN